MEAKFSQRVKDVISFSREEALRLGNDFIGAEHLMLGLIRDQENTAIKVLKQLNVNLGELRKEIELAVEEAIKTGESTKITCLSVGKNSEGIVVAEFNMHWTFKVKN